MVFCFVLVYVAYILMSSCLEMQMAASLHFLANKLVLDIKKTGYMPPENPAWCAAAAAYYSEPAPLHRLISVCNYGCVFPAIACLPTSYSSVSLFLALIALFSFCVHCESAKWKYKQEAEWVQSEGFVREDNSEAARTTNPRITVITECSLCIHVCHWRQSHDSLFALWSSFLDRPQKKKLPARQSFSCANITLRSSWTARISTLTHSSLPSSNRQPTSFSRPISFTFTYNRRYKGK